MSPTTAPATTSHRGHPAAPPHWNLEPLTATIGAVIHGADLGEVSRDDEQFAALHQLLLTHKVLFFRDQPMTRGEHVALAERFGPLEDHPVAPSDPDHPGLVRIYKDVDSPPDRYENAYHSDGSWRAEPAMGSILRCVECPPVGGDTIWVDMVRAYADLPAGIKAQLAGLHARHSIEATFGAVLPAERRRGLAATYPDAEHPVVRTHPETGEQILYVNSFTTHFVDFHTPERVRHGADFTQVAPALLTYLQNRATIPDYQVRFRWQPGSVAIWDNRSTQHYAVMDYWPGRRRMERAGIRGDRPF
ncbi:taurine dioxygenase [Enemella evansiae]|uniref:TauD/TfdA dioxygenase family protein n=1 Tax=Enemella evansiae TaxID=2016499 RepID=UPI000B96FA83|nr:TauD/TfdA family dioxygenase [Enemella evansiae]OYO10190.1 taurine dioxygenase [Enemella evansiae]